MKVLQLVVQEMGETLLPVFTGFLALFPRLMVDLSQSGSMSEIETRIYLGNLTMQKVKASGM